VWGISDSLVSNIMGVEQPRKFAVCWGMPSGPAAIVIITKEKSQGSIESRPRPVIGLRLCGGSIPETSLLVGVISDSSYSVSSSVLCTTEIAKFVPAGSAYSRLLVGKSCPWHIQRSRISG